jgi:hypothetical protein
MLPSTSAHDNASENVHPDKVNDENKHLTKDSGTHEKTEAHEHTNTRRKSDATEHTTIRRKSDAERHAYADSHAKGPHTGIDASFNCELYLLNV